jgi:hypothetical protein
MWQLTAGRRRAATRAAAAAAAPPRSSMLSAINHTLREDHASGVRVLLRQAAVGRRPVHHRTANAMSTSAAAADGPAVAAAVAAAAARVALLLLVATSGANNMVAVMSTATDELLQQPQQEGILVDWAAQRRQWESGGRDLAAQLQANISAAIAKQSPQQLAVAAGRYLFGNRTLLIENATDFALVAAGDGPVELIFANHRGGVVIRSCINVTISGRNASGTGGIHVDRSPPPFAQGTVTKSRAGASAVEFTLDGDSADPRSLSGGVDPTDHWPNGS